MRSGGSPGIRGSQKRAVLRIGSIANAVGVVVARLFAIIADFEALDGARKIKHLIALLVHVAVACFDGDTVGAVGTA
jgi:hypothetical protein